MIARTGTRGVAILFAAATLAGSAGSQQPPVTQRPDRTNLEQQLRVRIAQVTQRRLGLSDAQMTQLQAVNSRYAPQMATLASQERETRQALRAQIMAPAPDQAQVSKLLDTVIRLQKQRIALLESEQNDLGAFLTPVQRAKYLGLQAQIKRRADQLRRRMNARSGFLRDSAGIRPPR